MRIRMSRITAVVSTTLLAGLMAACGSDTQEGTNSSPEKSSTSTAKPSASAPTTTGSRSSTPSGSKQTASEPSPSDSAVSLEDRIFKAIDKAVKDENTIDIGLTNNSACDRSKGETLELSKFVGEWSDGPYFIVDNYAVAPIELTDTSYTVTPKKNGNPQNDWSFSCSGGATGYYVYRFVKIFEDGEVQVTEDVGITVSK